MAIKIRKAEPIGQLKMAQSSQPVIRMATNVSKPVVRIAQPRNDVITGIETYQRPQQQAAQQVPYWRTKQGMQSNPLQYFANTAGEFGKGMWNTGGAAAKMLAQGMISAPERLLRSTAGLAFNPDQQDLLRSDLVAGIPGTEELAKVLYGGPIETYQDMLTDDKTGKMSPWAIPALPLMAGGDALGMTGTGFIGKAGQKAIIAAGSKNSVKDKAVEFLINQQLVGTKRIPVHGAPGRPANPNVHVRTIKKIPVRYEPSNEILDKRMSTEVAIQSDRADKALADATKSKAPLLNTEAVNTKTNMVFDDIATKREAGTLPQRIEVKDPPKVTKPKVSLKAKPTSTTVKKPASDRDLLNIKISRVKDPARKAELIAEREALGGAKLKVSARKTKDGDAYAILKQEAADARDANKVGKLSHAWSEFKRKIIDPYAPLANSDYKAAKARGVKESELPAGDKLVKLASDLHNKDAVLDREISTLKLHKGRTLKNVMEKYPNGQRMENFLIYVANKSDLENRGIKGGKKLNPQLADDQVAKAVADFERLYPDAEDDARIIKYFKDAMEMEGVRTGSLTMDDAVRAVKSRQFYYPTKTVDSGKIKPRIVDTMKGSTAEQRIIKSREGGSGPVDYSWDAVVSRFQGDKTQNMQARFYRELARRADEGTAGARRVTLKGKGDGPMGYDPSSEFGKQLYRGLENGEPTALEIDQNLAKMFKSLSQDRQKDLITTLNNIPVAIAKTVFTGVLNPVFHALNTVKNPFVLLHNRGFGAFGVRPIVSGFAGAVNKGKFSERGLVYFGANQIKATQNVATPRIRAEMLALDKKNVGEVAKFTLDHPWTSLKAVGRTFDHTVAFSDRTFRSMAARQAYIKAQRKGMSETASMEKAAEAYNESLGNFNRVTEAARAAEPIMLYSGAIQAGARAWGKAYRNNPFQTLLVDASFAGAVGYMVKTNYESESGHEFYEDMVASKKEYVLNDNFIMVLPTAYKDDKTGEWVGVVKVPLAPDFRPLNRATWKTMTGRTPSPADLVGHFVGDTPKGISEIPTSNPAINAVSVALNRNPRTGEEIVGKFERTTKEVSEQYDPGYTSETAKGMSKVLNISPKQLDAFMDNLGLLGDTLQNKAGDPISTVKESFLKQFGKGLKGETSGGGFYKDLDEVSKDLKNEADFTAFTLLHTKNDDKTIDSPAARAKMLLAQPNVLAAENALNKRSVERGNKSNPFYDLDNEQQKKVLRYRSSKDLNAAGQSYSKDGKPLFTELGLDEEWYQTFRDNETAFYDDLEKKKAATGGGGSDTTDTESAASTYSGAKRPKDDALDALQDQYHTLPKGTGERTAFLNAHPELLKYWADKDGFTNAERLALGLKLNEEDDSSGPGSGSWSNYSSWGSRGSSGGGSSPNLSNPYAHVLKRGSKSKLSGKASSSGGKASVKLAGSLNTGSTAKPKVSIKKNKV